MKNSTMKYKSITFSGQISGFLIILKVLRKLYDLKKTEAMNSDRINTKIKNDRVQKNNKHRKK